MVALACVEGAAQVAQAELSKELDPGREIDYSRLKNKRQGLMTV